MPAGGHTWLLPCYMTVGYHISIGFSSYKLNCCGAVGMIIFRIEQNMDKKLYNLVSTEFV